MTEQNEFHQIFSDKIKAVEDIVLSYLPKEEGYQKTIFQAMNYTMSAGGKRIRPLFMAEFYYFFNGKEDIIKPFMAAIEMIHTYSLIHDDLPALDNDAYRRGKETAHIVYGEDMAILAGDGLLNYAFEVATSAFEMVKDSEDYVKIAKAIQILSKKPGIYGMIGGQIVDVELTGQALNKEQIDFIYSLKTGALLEASMMIGAVLGGADEKAVACIERAAHNIGMAFQIQDDILDFIGDSEELGKPIKSDEKNKKTTYVNLYGVEGAKQEVLRFSKEALTQLEGLGCKETSFLYQLVLSLIKRKN